MKKLLAIVLSLILVASLAACNQEKPNETSAPKAAAALQVGYGRESITPEEPLKLRSSGLMSTEVWDTTYATCIAFTDGENNTLLLFHMDLQICDTYSVMARKAISEKLGLSMDYIMTSATHTHGSPNTALVDDEAMGRYIKLLVDRMTKAAEAAMADRKPAEMYTASVELKNLNFVRHYVMNDGSIVGDKFGETAGKTYTKHVHDADNEMQLLRFKRQGGKDVVMVNWQAHPHRTGAGHSYITSDIVGTMRDYVEATMDCNFAYFTGASGNVNSSSRISSENITSNYKEQGQTLGKFAVMALEGAEKAKTGKVQCLARKQDALGFDIDTYAYSIGDVGFISAPYEMFDTNGKFIKDNSPFETTFIVTMSNGHSRYIASDATYEYGGYEIEVANYKRGCAEKLADGYVAMLKEIYPNRHFAGGSSDPTFAAQTTDLYWNLDKGADRKAGSDGTYTVNFLVGGKVTALKVADAAVMKQIDAQDVMGLTLDGDKVTGVTLLKDTGYSRLAWDYTVQTVAGKAIQLNSDDGLKGNEVKLTLADSAAVYDVTANAKTPGEITTVAENDLLTVIANEKGEAVYAFVTFRKPTAEPDPTPRYCQHCKKDITWLKWTDTENLPTAEGHYYLADNVTLSGTMGYNGGDMCLDLNGKTVTQTAFGYRIYNIQGAGNFNLMDSVGTGTLICNSSDESGKYGNGMILNINHANAVVNVYSGTLDASNITCEFAACVYIQKGTMNIYGGTFKGGKVYGSGSGVLAVSVNGTLNMYDGAFIGGENFFNGFTGSSAFGGGLMRVTGVANIYGGTFTGGKSEYNGGNLYVKPGAVLRMLGGTVSGGECAGNGAGIYVETGGKLILGGNVNVTDNKGSNLFVDAGGTFEIDGEGLDGAKIGISAYGTGEFVSGTFTAEDAACFISDKENLTVVLTDKGIALQG